jgi:uncharacterized membrane protein
MWLRDNYKLILITLGIILVIDLIYLNLNKKMYLPIMTNNPLKIHYGLIAWAIVAFTLSFFILSNDTFSKRQKMMYAFILGFCVYGIYNFSNMATLNNWNNKILIVDTLWGSSLFALVTFIVLYLKDAYKLF